MNLVTGTIIGERYEILTSISSGGMGAVYRAADRHFKDRVVALKQMLEEMTIGANAEMLHQRFEAEAEMLLSLRNPGIPRVIDHFRLGDAHFLVMEFVHGDSLDKMLDQSMALAQQPLQPAQVAAVAIDVCDILSYLHSRTPPLVHRDVKPGNIIVRFEDNRTYLVDFGVARYVDPNTAGPKTMVGTLGYSSIEQVSGKPQPRSDVYALGATMYHLLSGQPPTPFNLGPLEHVAPHVPASLSAIVARATRPTAEQRYETAEAMAVALRAALEGLRGAALPPASAFDTGEIIVPGGVPTLLPSMAPPSLVARAAAGPATPVPTPAGPATPVPPPGGATTPEPVAAAPAPTARPVPAAALPPTARPVPAPGTAGPGPAPTRPAVPVAAWAGALAVLAGLVGYALWPSAPVPRRHALSTASSMTAEPRSSPLATASATVPPSPSPAASTPAPPLAPPPLPWHRISYATPPPSAPRPRHHLLRDFVALHRAPVTDPSLRVLHDDGPIDVEAELANGPRVLAYDRGLNFSNPGQLRVTPHRGGTEFNLDIVRQAKPNVVGHTLKTRGRVVLRVSLEARVEGVHNRLILAFHTRNHMNKLWIPPDAEHAHIELKKFRDGNHAWLNVHHPWHRYTVATTLERGLHGLTLNADEPHGHFIVRNVTLTWEHPGH